MTPSETVILTRYVKALCPAQLIDEYTPDAWRDVLGEFSLAECRAAAAVLAGEERFIAVADIRKHALAARRSEAGRERVRLLNAADPVRAQVYELAARQPERANLPDPVTLGAAIGELGLAP